MPQVAVATCCFRVVAFCVLSKFVALCEPDHVTSHIVTTHVVWSKNSLDPTWVPSLNLQSPSPGRGPRPPLVRSRKQILISSEAVDFLQILRLTFFNPAHRS